MDTTSFETWRNCFLSRAGSGATQTSSGVEGLKLKVLAFIALKIPVNEIFCSYSSLQPLYPCYGCSRGYDNKVADVLSLSRTRAVCVTTLFMGISC